MSLYHPRPTLGTKPTIHTKFNLPGRIRVEFSLPSRTKQSFKTECDINVIMARYQATGVIQSLNKGEPRYVDTTGVDYQSAMNTVANARSLFEELPAHIRNRFKNDPVEMLQFAAKGENYEEALKMGLLDPAKAAATAAEKAAKAAKPVSAPSPTQNAAEPPKTPQTQS